MNRRTWALRVLGLEPGASDTDIREAYRDLVSVWHPDKHTANERIRKRAEEAMKRINTARDILLGGSTEEPSWGPEPGWEPPKETKASTSTDPARDAGSTEANAPAEEEAKAEEPPKDPPPEAHDTAPSPPQTERPRRNWVTLFFWGLAIVLSAKLLYNAGVWQGADKLRAGVPTEGTENLGEASRDGLWSGSAQEHVPTTVESDSGPIQEDQVMTDADENGAGSDGSNEGQRMLKEATTYVEKNLNRRQMFMEREGGRRWVTMATENDYLDKDGQWSLETGAVVYLWTKEGKPYYMTVAKSSMSGDWYSMCEMVYRRDGTLAYCEQSYSAFMPVEGRVERKYAFNTQGQRTFYKAEAMDMQGKRRYAGEKAKQLSEAADEFGGSVLRFLKVAELPFGELIR